MGPRGGDVVLDCGAALADEIAQGRVIVCPRGVWDKEDKLVLRIVPDDPYDSSLVRQGSSVPGVVVPLTIIDAR